MALSQWETAAITSFLTQSKSTIDADQPVTGQAFLHVGQSVYSSASCRADRSSSTYLQILKSAVGRSADSFAHMHARLEYEHAPTHMRQQLTLPDMKHSNLMATKNENSRHNGSEGLHYRTYKSLSIRLTQNRPLLIHIKEK